MQQSLLQSNERTVSARTDFSYSTILPLLKSLRPQHWTKNALVFVPILAAHRFLDLGLWIIGVRAFVAFAATASSVYLINDFLDLESDRAHPTKRNRPMASGDLPARTALVTVPFLLGIAFFVSYGLPGRLTGTLAAYLLANLAYSLRLKKVLLVDVVVLTFMHVARVLAGGFATRITISTWLFTFMCFFFFGLAMLKRFSELRGNAAAGSLPGRGYQPVDQKPVFMIGLVNSMISILVFVLYLDSTQAKSLYRHVNHLWLMAPLLIYWTSRIWLLAGRGEVEQDPVSFALRDKATWLCGCCFIVILFWST